MKLVKTTPTNQTARRIPIFVPNRPNTANNKAEQVYRKIALPSMEGIHFEKVEEIVNLEARGNYTSIHFINGKKLLVCKTLRDMELLLNAGNQFVRIHRSFTINLNLLQKYIKGKGGYVVMENKSSISVSAGKKQDFLSALEIYFGG
jgi:two-component system LytT family response regulator